jgi:hypothetical protein
MEGLLLGQLAAAAVRVTVAEGEKKTQEASPV